MRLLTAVAVALLPAYAFRLLWLLATDGTGRSVNDVLTFDGQSWVLLAGEALFWTVAVLLGVAVLDGAPRPLVRTLKGLPRALFLLAVLAVLMLLGFAIVRLTVPGEPAGFIFVGIVVCVPLIAVASRLATGAVPGVVEADSDYRTRTELTGRRWRTGALYAVGVVAPLLIASQLISAGQPDGLVPGLLASLWTTIVLTAAAAIQSLTLLRMYHSTRGTDPVPPVHPARPRKAIWLATAGAVALIVPTALTSGVVAASGLPAVNRGPQIMKGRIITVAWPGQHPILIGQSTVYDCLDDTCTRDVRTDLGLTMFPPTGNAVVQPDGTLYAFGQAEITVCDPQRRCEGGRARGLIDELGIPVAAVLAVGPDGNPVIAAVARPDKETVAALTLHRCHDRLCKTSDAEHVDDVRYFDDPSHWSFERRRIALDVDAGGHATIAVRGVDGVRLFGAPSAAQTASLHRALGAVCDLSICGDEYQGLAMDRPGGGAYAVQVVHGGRPVLLQAGRPKPLTHTALLVCSDRSCRDPLQRIPIESSPRVTGNQAPPMPDEIWYMAVAGDGRAVLVRPLSADRIYAVTP